MQKGPAPRKRDHLGFQQTKQYNDFSRCVITVAGKISVYMGESIDQQEKIGFMAFKPEPKDQRDWTDDDRNIDPAKSS